MFMQLVKIQTQVVCALVCRAEFVSFQGGKCNLRKKQCCGTLSGSAGETKTERLRASNTARMTVSLTQPPM